MLEMNRRLVGLAVGSALVLGSAAAVPATAHDTTAKPAAPAACSPNYPVTNSFIEQRWSDLGGQDGLMGCPRGRTKNVFVNGVKKGQRQYFANGNITWSPAQGPEMVVAAWERNGYAYVNWGTTDPYHYDLFLVRYTSAADPNGTQRRVGSGTSGGMWVRKHTTGDYTFIVEGCDKGTYGLKCRQGWTLSATTHN